MNRLLPPKPFDTIFGPIEPRVNPDFPASGTWSPQAVQIELNAYDASIRYLDEQLGLLFTELERENVLNNTLVIITSDHGEEFLEHGVMGHGYSLYRPSLQVPLLSTSLLECPADRRIDTVVSLRDLAANRARCPPD